MTIRLLFTVNKEPFRITIYKKEIYYSDRFSTQLWGKGTIRLIPKDPEFIRKITMSRNRLPAVLKEMFDLTPKEQREYEEANSEEELAYICKKDAIDKGGLFISMEKIEDNEIEVKEE